MIAKILVANRGEIAIRIFQTLREMGISTVAVFTEPDVGALHVRSADQSVRIDSYLDPSDIIRAAKESGSEAIHPGYGFLSENVSLASACESAGLKFIGPKPETIHRMGDKVESKRIIEKAGVPVVQSWDRTPPESEFPVLVKAVGGGGGKGMRLVERLSELDAAMAAASREADKAFGDGRVFVEKYIKNPRHIEFQVFGDTAGNVIHLFERECSIQRRHQKIIEETPSPALTPQLRAQMGEAAVAAARAVNYINAGTVEFIAGPDGRFYFLEMNTRLQVEHPVTEMTTGLDLVREQISITDGQPLSVKQSDLRQMGHALECRIYAEVPEENFRPDVGTISIFRPPAGPGIRLDTGVEEGSEVSFHYDPMLAKLIVWASNRDASIDRMKRALKEFVLLGVRTNIEFLHRLISHEDFRRGQLDTHFIERHSELLHPTPSEPPVEAVIAASLGVSGRTKQRASEAGIPAFSDVWASGPWRIS